jgi:hypothetical protein
MQNGQDVMLAIVLGLIDENQNKHSTLKQIALTQWQTLTQAWLVNSPTECVEYWCEVREDVRKPRVVQR